MRYLKLTIVMVLLIIFTITLYAQAPDIALKDKTIQEQVEYWAKFYDIDKERMLKVIKCESGFNPNAIHYNDGGKGKHSVGLMQFQKSTFDLWEKKLGEDLDYYSYYDQIKLASFMWSKNQMNQWTCYAKTK